MRITEIRDDSSVIEEFKTWYRKYTSAEFPHVTSSGRSLNITGDIRIYPGPNLKDIPFDILQLKGSLEIMNCKITSMESCPRYVYGNLLLNSNEIASIEGAPNIVTGDVELFNNKIVSLKNVHSHFKRVHGEMNLLNNPIESNALGLLLIDDLEKLVVNLDGPIRNIFRPSENKTLIKVFDILNEYLPNHRGMSAVLEAQEELLEAGLDDYAAL